MTEEEHESLGAVNVKACQINIETSKNGTDRVTVSAYDETKRQKYLLVLVISISDTENNKRTYLLRYSNTA